MREGNRVAMIIPALNEAPNLPEVLRRVPAWVDRICVVDNGSTDGTAEVARRCGALAEFEHRRGYGWACTKGIEACDDFDVLLFADADGSDELSAAHRLVDPVAHNVAEMVLGNRLTGMAQPGSLSWPQRSGNALACWLMRRRFGFHYADLGPFRAVRASVLRDLQMCQMTYGWTVEMQIRARVRGHRVIEVPVPYRTRLSGRSKVSRSLTGIVRAGYHIIRTIQTEPIGEGSAN